MLRWRLSSQCCIGKGTSPFRIAKELLTQKEKNDREIRLSLQWSTDHSDSLYSKDSCVNLQWNLTQDPEPLKWSQSKNIDSIPGQATKRLTGKGGKLNTSQAEPVVASSWAGGQFLSISREAFILLTRYVDRKPDDFFLVPTKTTRYGHQVHDHADQTWSKRT